MAQFINSATLVHYNANVRNNDVGDCVCRSISFAFDISYSAASKKLNEWMKKKYKHQWNIPVVFNPLIKELGGSDPESITEPYPTVNEFADGNPDGCFIILCGPQQEGNSTNHMVCIIDGKVYDSWDSRRYYAKRLYVCSEDRHVADTDIQSKMKELSEFGRDEARKEIDRLNAKWIEKEENGIQVKCRISWIQGNFAGYAMTFRYQASYTISDSTYEDSAGLQFKIACALKPGMTEEEARSHIVKTMKQRAYDRMYAVREQIKKDVEAFQVSHQDGVETANQDYMFTTPAEKRFISQLPGKVKPFISYIDIQRPGQYSNSYTIKIKSMPGDSNPEYVRIEAYDANAAKDMILRYVKNFERPYDDYDPYEDY